ncbi:hypothetical protein KQX54_018923 [Cotesia glomerata]|uniref:C2H2-type domain-containing protein n=1 Tax=Cotesia glomerata TaxID=32391 RepID=A0AAV7I6L0_COTGL|nr:hypothetical protein KQX54_018923 [Cotesia glomerata]
MYGGGGGGEGGNAAGDSHESVEPRWTPPSSGVLLSPVSVVSNTQNSENYPQNHNHEQHHEYQHHVSPRNGAYESPYSPIYQQRIQNQIFMHKSAMQSAMHARDLGPGGLGRPGGVPGGLAGLGVGVGPGGMITGNEVKPHQCQQCLKSFSSNHQLVQHIRVHTGEKPYKCSYCDRRFKQLSHVQQHTRLHTAFCPSESYDRFDLSKEKNLIGQEVTELLLNRL